MITFTVHAPLAVIEGYAKADLAGIDVLRSSDALGYTTATANVRSSLFASALPNRSSKKRVNEWLEFIRRRVSELGGASGSQVSVRASSGAVAL